MHGSSDLSLSIRSHSQGINVGDTLVQLCIACAITNCARITGFMDAAVA